MFEKTLIGGFTCINTKLAFDKKILMNTLSSKDFDKLTIDEHFKKKKKKDLKPVYWVQLEGKNEYHDRIVVSKILKLDENHHYSQAMTTPLPTGSIKSKRLFQVGKNSIY